jgi:ribonuclease HI/exonuclease III
VEPARQQSRKPSGIDEPGADDVLRRFDDDDARWLESRQAAEPRWRPKLTVASRKDRASGSKGAAKRRAALKAETLSFASWNCNGLSAERLDYLVGSQDGEFPGLLKGPKNLSGYDLIGVNECHEREQELAEAWGSDRMFVGGPCVKGDGYSGVCFLTSRRLADAVSQQGQGEGMFSSHIKWIRIDTDVGPIYAVNVYVPHAGRSAPDAEGVLEELKRVVRRFPSSAAVILMGDFNGRMGRSDDFTGKPGGRASGGVTGQWCVHDSENEQGKQVRQMAEDLDLVAVSTFYRPRRKRGGAGTWQPYGDKKDFAVANLDYLFVCRRWRTSCLSTKVRWGPSEHRFVTGNGVRKDHGMLSMKYRVRLTKAEKVHRPDRKYWKTDDGRAAVEAAWVKVAEKYDGKGADARGLADSSARGDSASGAELDGMEDEPALDSDENQARTDRFLSVPPTDYTTDASMRKFAATDEAETLLWRTMATDDGVSELIAMGWGVEEWYDTRGTPDPAPELPPLQHHAAAEGLRRAGLSASADRLLSEDPVMPVPGISVSSTADDMLPRQEPLVSTSDTVARADMPSTEGALIQCDDGGETLRDGPNEPLRVGILAPTAEGGEAQQLLHPIATPVQRAGSKRQQRRDVLEGILAASFREAADSELTLSPHRNPGSLSLEELGLGSWMQAGGGGAVWRLAESETTVSDAGDAPVRIPADSETTILDDDGAASPRPDDDPDGDGNPTQGCPAGRAGPTVSMAERHAAQDAREVRYTSIAKEVLRLLPAERPMATSRFFSISEDTRKFKQKSRDKATKSGKSARSKADCKIFNDKVRRDYRRWVEALLAEVQKLDDMGNVKAVGKLFDRLARRSRGGSHQPTKDAETGKLYESEEAALEGWRIFLSDHYVADEEEDARLFEDLGEPDPEDQELSDADLERAQLVLRGDRAVGDDETPVELIRASPTAKSELFVDVREIWRTEYAPQALAIGLFCMIWKGASKGTADNHANYRPIDLQNHRWKVIGVLLLMRLIEETELFLPESQNGFRWRRGGRDSLLRTRLFIERVLGFGRRAWLFLQDYRSAFDSARHSSLERSLKRAGATRKSLAMFRLISKSARGVVKVRRANGTTGKSKPFDIDRGVIQGGMDSPWDFVLGLACVLQDADPQRRSLDYDIRQGVQLLRKGGRPSHTGAAYEAYEAAKERFRAVEGDAVLETEEEPKLEFERLWFTAVKKGAGALHAAVNAAKSTFEAKRAEMLAPPEERPAGWTAAGPGAAWQDELEERQQLRKCFHPISVRLPRGVVPQCQICDTAWPIPGFCDACQELEFRPTEGYWERMRREQASVVDDEDREAVARMMHELSSEDGSPSDEDMPNVAPRENLVDRDEHGDSDTDGVAGGGQDPGDLVPAGGGGGGAGEGADGGVLRDNIVDRGAATVSASSVNTGTGSLSNDGSPETRHHYGLRSGALATRPDYADVDVDDDDAILAAVDRVQIPNRARGRSRGGGRGRSGYRLQSRRGRGRGMGLRGSRGEYADDVELWEVESAENGQKRLQSIADVSHAALGMLAAPEKYDGLPIQPVSAVSETTSADVKDLPKKIECPNECGKFFAAVKGLTVHMRQCRYGDGEFEESPERDGKHDVEALLDVRGPPNRRYWRVKWAGKDEAGADLHPDTGTAGNGTAAACWMPEYLLDGCDDLINEYWRNHRDKSRHDDISGPEGEVRCEFCNQIFGSKGALTGHLNRKNKLVNKRCTKQPPLKQNYTGSELDRVVKERKRLAMLELLEQIEIFGKRTDGTWTNVRLKLSLQAKLLGHQVRGDGDTLPDIRSRCGQARQRFNQLTHMWKDKSLKVELKLAYYLRLITSIVAWGNEAWKLDKLAQRKLNGFNSRCVSVITGQTARQEASEKTRTIDIVGVLRYRRRQYLGHILRSDPASLLRQDVLQYAELVRTGALDGAGGILMDVLGDYDTVGELLSLAGCYDWGDAEEDRRAAHAQWTLDSKLCMSEADRTRMQRRSPGEPPPANQKANTAAETIAKLAEIVHGLRVYTDGGCDGNGQRGVWGKAGWGVHVVEVLPDGTNNPMADLWGPVITMDMQSDSRWCMGAEKGTNNTGELNGIGQGLMYLRDHDGTDDAAVFLYDSMYAANMVQGLWDPSSSVQMIRNIRTVLDDVREGRSLCGMPRKVYFVHIKSHQDDASDNVTDVNVLGNVRADTLVQWGKGAGPYSRLCVGGDEGDGVDGPSPRWEAERQQLVDRAAASAANSRENMVDRDGPQAGVGRASDSVRRSDERSVTDGGEQAVDSSAKADAVETSSADISGNGAVNTLGTDPLAADGMGRRRVEQEQAVTRPSGASGTAGTAAERGGRTGGGRVYTLSELAELEELAAMEEASETQLRNIDDGRDEEDDTFMSGESRIGSRGPTLCTTTSTNTS